MALIDTTITTIEPAPLVAAENPIVLSLSTGSVGSPQYSKMRLVCDGFDTDGLTLTFNLTEPAPYTKKFYARHFPNQDNFFFTNTIKDREGNVVASGLTFSQQAESLAECLQKDIFISRYYHINYTGGTKIYLVAKEASSRFNLSGKVSSTNGAELSPVNEVAGSDQYEGSTVQDYSLYVEIFHNDTYEFGDTLSISNFNRVSELVLPFSSDNTHIFDVSEICKAFVSTPRPDFELTGFTESTYMKPFAFRYGEIYPVVPNESTKKRFEKGITDFKWVANASLDYEQANTLTGYTGTTTVDGRLLNIPYLTNSPNPKRTNKEAKELLYYLMPSGLDEDFKLYTDLTFWDGTSSNNNLIADVNYSAGGLQCINSSFNILDLSSFETGGKKIKSADVYINSLETTLVQTEVLLNNSFNTNLNSWTQSSSGTSFTWGWNTGGRATSYLGDAETAFIFSGWSFTSDMDGWVNDGGLLPEWAYSTGYSGSVKVTTDVDDFGVKNLRFNNIDLPHEEFDITIGFAAKNVDGSQPDSNDLFLRLLIRDSGNTQLYNEVFATPIYSGAEQTAVLHVSDSTMWEDADHILIVVASTNFDPDDEIYITFVQLSTVGLLNFERTNVLKQASLVLEPELDYTFRYDITFSGGTTNKFFAKFYDISNNPVGSTMMLVSGGTGHYTGSTAITDTFNEDIYGIQMWVENVNASTQYTVNFNEFSIMDDTVQDSVLTATTVVRKTYLYPYTQPVNRFGVAFLNKLGTWDTFDFIGLKEETLDRTTKNITYPVTPNSNGSLPEGFKHNAQYDIQVTKKIVVNSGWIDQVHYNWLIELLSSNEIYSYTEQYVNYLKLESHKYSKNNQSNEYNIEATFVHTIFENTISI